MLVHRYQRRDVQQESLARLPLYPDEVTPWDEAVVPPEDFVGDGCLALPKLNLQVTGRHTATATVVPPPPPPPPPTSTSASLPPSLVQFLTINDYLMRNFTLFRLEATFEVKEDIEDAVHRMQPRRTMSGSTVFKGWARMALPLTDFRLFRVGKPFLGELKPSDVRAEASINLGGGPPPRGAAAATPPTTTSSWSPPPPHPTSPPPTSPLPRSRRSGRPSASTTSSSSSPSPPPSATATSPTPTYRSRSASGLSCVRGGEVVQVVDDEGHVFTGESENDQSLRGKGRKIELSLDPAQYHVDAQAMAEGGGADVYSSFNVLLRRKPKENNFKAIFDCLRDLMTTPLVVPEWLLDVLLGYGDPPPPRTGRSQRKSR